MLEGGPINPIENYLPALKTIFENSGVVLAYLYGSQATAAAGPLSDVDIAVLFAPELDEEARFHQVLGLHGELSNVFKRDDVHVVDLATGTPLLNNEIRLHGVVVHNADNQARVEFEVRTLQRFIDTEPLRRELNKYLAEKIRRGLFGQPTAGPPVRTAR